MVSVELLLHKLLDILFYFIFVLFYYFNFILLFIEYIIIIISGACRRQSITCIMLRAYYYSYFFRTKFDALLLLHRLSQTHETGVKSCGLLRNGVLWLL